MAAICAPADAAQPHAPALSALVQVADLSAVSASPDGRAVAVRLDRPSIERNSYDLTWHIVDTATGGLREIGTAGEPIHNDPGLLAADTPVWSPDGRWLYYRALRSGAVQVWRSAADGSRSEAVTAEDGDVLSLAPALNGAAINYRVGPPRDEIARAELAEYDAGILIDEHVELGQNLFRGAIINGRRATQRLTGTWFSRGGLLWSRPPQVRRLDFGTLTSSALDSEAGTAAGSTGAAPGMEATSSKGHRAAASWSGIESKLVVVRTAAEGASIRCGPAACRADRIAWVAWRPGRNQVVFAVSNRAFRYELRLWDIGSGQVRTVARSDGLLTGGRDEDSPCALTRSEAVCVTASPGSPPHLQVFDLETSARRSLFDPNRDLRARRWPQIERLSWQSPDGKQFTGVLFLPDGVSPERLPLFINYYRCEGFIRGGMGDEWPFALLAAGGIASVCVNAIRISGPQDAVEHYRAALSGIEALIDRLAGRGLIDRQRVGMGGLSFGSEVTMWAVVHSDLIAAASVASPQFEPANYWFNGVRGRDHHQLLRQVWALGSPEETPERWRLVSPALNVDRIRAPLLLQLPEQESRYAVELYARLSNSATPTEMYVFPDEPHIKVQPRRRLAVYGRNIDWFRFWLQDHVDPDPAKADQYRRWRALAARFRAAQPRQERSQSSSETKSKIRK